MKLKSRFYLLALMSLGLVAKSFAADLLVAENGAGGAYATITDAITAAKDGDRIFVTPKSGGSPYGENIAIIKSLQFLSNKEGEKFVVNGSITITPSVGMTVTFLGMKDLSGDITTTGASPAGARTEVKVVNCELTSGSVKFDYDNFNVQVVSSVINGYVNLRYGKVIGNSITSPTSKGYSIGVTTDAASTNDTIMIIGNKISQTYEYYYAYDLIRWNSSSQYFSIQNNFLSIGGASYYAVYGIEIYTTKQSSTGRNQITNNTIYSLKGNTAIHLFSVLSNSFVDLTNNLILGTATTKITSGITIGTNAGVISNSYAFFGNVTTPLTGITDDGTNNLNSNATIDNDGKLAALSDAIDGGNPDSTYYDINLTRNDVGAYGGSFTLDNFFPITGSARVYFIQAPRRVIIGNTINVKAEAFDR